MRKAFVISVCSPQSYPMVYPMRTNCWVTSIPFSIFISTCIGCISFVVLTQYIIL